MLILALERAIETVGVTGGDKYRVLLQNFFIFVRTCSDRTLACLPKLMFLDLGSIFAASVDPFLLPPRSPPLPLSSLPTTGNGSH